MFTHAYQSFIWNTVASERILKWGCQAIPGDLVFDPNPSTTSLSVLPCKNVPPPTKAITLIDLESEIILDLDESFPLTVDPLTESRTLNSLSPSQEKEESFVPPSVLRLTSKNAHQFSIQDIILPLPGSDVLYPENEFGDLYTTLMRIDGLNPHAMHQVHKLSSLSLSSPPTSQFYSILFCSLVSSFLFFLLKFQ